MTDSYVQVAADGVGKKIDNSQLTREKPDPAWDATEGDTVQRQRVVVGSDENPELQVRVDGEAGDATIQIDAKAAGHIVALLTEIRDLLKLFIG